MNHPEVSASPGMEWLMQYQILRLVNHCRRLVVSEFGDKLSLGDPDLRFKLADYAGRTRSQGFQHLYGELQLALIDLEGLDPSPEPEPVLEEEAPAVRERPVRMYRGRPVYVTEKAPDQVKTVSSGGVESEDASAAKKKRQVMYRGQRVTG